MLKTETVFVIGAGASKEVGLPIGCELASIIRAKMDIDDTGDKELFNEIRSLADNGDEYGRAAARIRDGVILANSIDDFLDQNNDDAYIKLYGKAAIVKSIIEAERNSQLFFQDTGSGSAINYDRISSTWYVSFFKMLTRGVSRENLDDNISGLTFISFNYDRCLEFFLFNSLKQCYGIDARKAADIINTAKIFHPYGVVGALPFQNKNIFVQFGGDQRGNKCVDLASQIRTYTEEVAEDNQINDIKDAVSRSALVVFLGFGFHRQNLHILTNGDKSGSVHKDILATGWGISPSNCYKYNEDIKSRFSCNESYVYPHKRCFELLNSLSARIFV